MLRNTRLFILIICAAFIFEACGKKSEALSPVETLKKYTEAVQKKDITQMKLLLSAATIKLHTDQAKAQNVNLDEIVNRETLFPPDQRVFAYRNQVIEGDKATVDVKNNFGGWDKIFLVKEGGAWKIDKKGTAEKMIEQVDADVDKLDEQMDAERKKTEELMDQQDATGADSSPSPSPGGGSDQTLDTPGSPLTIRPASPM